MNYKGYFGSMEKSEEDSVLFGNVPGIRALISFEGDTEKQLEADFHAAVDDYLVLCVEQGIEPEKAKANLL